MAGVAVRTEAIFGRNQLGRFAQEIEDGVMDTLDQMGEELEDVATQNLPVTPKGKGRIAPRLKRGFAVVRTDSQVWLESRDGLTGIYEFGTKRWYPIEPRGEAALTNPDGSFGPVLGPGGRNDPIGVNHPGQPAWRFLRKSYDRARSRYMGVLRDNLPG